MAEASYSQTNFLGGEWSPFFQGRTDHPKYRTAMNVSRNGLPLEEGSWVRRPGSRLKAPTYQNKPGRIYPVEFTTSQPYDVEFTDGWMRFYSGHKLVFTTDGPQTVTSISTANPAVVLLSAAVTWATGDEIYFAFDAAHSSGALPLRQRSFTVTKIDTTHFSLTDTITGATIDGSTLAVPAGATITVSRVLRIASPYINGSWAVNRIVQNQDMGVVLNGAYPPHRLTITPGTTAGTASAVLDTVVYMDGPYLDPVTDTAGTASVLYWSGGTYTGPPVMTFPTVSPPAGIGQVIATAMSYVGSAVQYIFAVYTGFTCAANGGGPLGSTQNTLTSFDISGWAFVDPNGIGAHVSGTITVQAGFEQWSASIAYETGNYVNVGTTTSYKAIANSVGVQPGVTGGWATYWVAVDSGIAITGDGNTPVGFQTTDVGRLIRIWSSPPEWDPTVIYADGALVAYQGIAYAATGASNFRPPRAGLNPATSFTAPQWGRIMLDQFDASQTGTPDAFGTTATLMPGWAPVGQAGQWSWGRIASVTSSSTATVTLDTDSAPIVAPLGNPPITNFRMGLWSGTTSYPTCGSFYEGRFWFGGAVPNRFDTSQSQGWRKGSNVVDMAPTATIGDQTTGFTSDGTVTDACGISYTFESRDTNEIVWFEPDHNGIMCGTAGGEWLIQASTLSDPITPTSIQAKRVTKYGCANIEPKRTGISLVFIQKFRRRVMEFLADVFTGRYVAPHLNEAAKHISKDGIVEIGYQEELAPVLWARTGDEAAKGLVTSTESILAGTLDSVYTSTLASLSNNNLTLNASPTVNVIGMAIDLDAKLVWFFNPWTGGWNYSNTANPATGVGGYSWSASPTPPIYPACNVDNGATVTLVPAAPFNLPVPSGFSAWGACTWNTSYANTNLVLSNGNMTATGPSNLAPAVAGAIATLGHSTGKWYYEMVVPITGSLNPTAVGFFDGTMPLVHVVSPAGIYQAFNLNAHGFGIDSGGVAWQLPSGGNSVGNAFYMSTTSSGGLPVWRTALGTLSHTTGKWYFEVTINALAPQAGAQPSIAFGISNHAFTQKLTSTLGTGATLGSQINSIGGSDKGGVAFNGTTTGNDFSRYLTPGETIGVAVDLDNALIWFYDPISNQWNGQALANQNPATATGGFSFSGMPMPAYPAMMVGYWNNVDTLTANFGGAPFLNTEPAGFLPWATSVLSTVTNAGYTVPPGGLAGATYRRVSAFTTEAPAFVGWHRHDLGHGRKLTSIGVGPTGDGVLDNLDMVTTDGTNYYVEGLTQIFDEDDDLTNAWFVDGGLVPDSAYADTVAGVNGIRFTGLWYFVGQTVTVCAFGLDLGDFVVDANGTVFVPYGSGTAPASIDYTAPGAGAYLFTAAFIASHLLVAPGRNGAVAYSTGYIPCVVGHTFTSQGQILRPSSPEQSGSRTGPAMAKKRRSHFFGALFHNAIGTQVGTDFGNTLYPTIFKDDGDNPYTPTQMYSGTWRNSIADDYSYDSMISWQVLRPYPASLVSIGAFLKTQDG